MLSNQNKHANKRQRSKREIKMKKNKEEKERKYYRNNYANTGISQIFPKKQH